MAEITAQIEIADDILQRRWECTNWNWMRDYHWLENECARLVCELAAQREGAEAVSRGH
jgi:hypothetical protein